MVGRAQPGPAAAVEGRLDGDGGVARAVEPQGLAIAGVSRVTGDDPGQVVCHTQSAAVRLDITGESFSQVLKLGETGKHSLLSHL